MGRTRRDEVRGAEEGMRWCWRIAMESTEFVYSWDTEGNRKTEELGIGDKMD